MLCEHCKAIADMHVTGIGPDILHCPTCGTLSCGPLVVVPKLVEEMVTIEDSITARQRQEWAGPICGRRWYDLLQLATGRPA